MAAHPKTVGVVSKFVPTWRSASYGQYHPLRKARPFMLSLMKQSMKVIAFFFCLASCLLAARAVHGDSGILEIRVKDHRDAIADFSKFTITIDKILLSPKPGLKIWQTGWNELAASAVPIDLTKYVNKTSAQVFRGKIESGSFDAFHLKVKTIVAILNQHQKSAPVKNTIAPVKLAFNVAPRGETVLILDLTVTDMSDHPPRGYELAIQGYELFTDGKLIQKIPPG